MLPALIAPGEQANATPDADAAKPRDLVEHIRRRPLLPHPGPCGSFPRALPPCLGRAGGRTNKESPSLAKSLQPGRPTVFSHWSGVLTRFTQADRPSGKVLVRDKQHEVSAMVDNVIITV